MGWLADETGLEKCTANYVPLTPLSHLNRALDVFPERTAVIYGTRKLSYVDYHARVSRLASALRARGIAPGDVVATLLPNTLPQVEAHFGVPACGAILNAINTRLDVATIAYIFEHGGAKIVLCDTALLPIAEEALKAMNGPAPQIIEVADPEHGFEPTGHYLEYEALLAKGDPLFDWIMPQDEWESIALNYTSGTTGRPKGVVYHHRGAYLSTIGNMVSWRMQLYPVLLTIVPLFHCNSWTHPWMVPMLGGTVVCCRDVTAKAIYDAIADHGVTHFGGAPIVLNTLVNANESDRRAFDHIVEVFTAGAPPPASTLAAVEPLGFNVTQTYGLTETYGPSVECTWKPAWDNVAGDERASLKARTRREDGDDGDRDRARSWPRGHARRGPSGRDRDARQYGDERLLQEPASHARGVRGRRVPFRRHRVHASRWLHQDHRPRQGHHHFGRRECLVCRG